MISTCRSDDVYHQKTIGKITGQKNENFSQSSFQNNTRSSSLRNDIFVSRSGQAKINNLNSCRTLGDCDFIVF